MDFNWYALRCKPRKELSVCKHVNDLGIEVFYPILRVKPVNPRASRIKPYFPGYLFVRLDLENSRAGIFQWMPFTLGLVSFGGEPAPVPEHLINTLRKRTAELAVKESEDASRVKPGDPVSIEYGPFKGYEAIFDAHLSGSERVRILLAWLDARQIPLELRASDLRPKF